MTTNVEWNLVSTAKIAYDALRQRNLLIGGPDFEGPLMPWDLLRERLPRGPVVFVLSTNAPVGDEAPFMRLLAELVEQLPGRYVMLRASMNESMRQATPQANQQAQQQLKGMIVETHDEEEWARMFRQSPPDVVLTSQLFFVPPGATIHTDHRIRLMNMLHAIRQDFAFPIYTVESTPLNAGCVVHMKNWQDRVDAGTATIEEYQQWQASPEVDQSEVELNQKKYGYKYGLSLLAINCYPAELMTKEEMTRPTGIICGNIEPSISPLAMPERMRSMVEEARKAGKKIVFLARGGKHARTSIAKDLGHGVTVMHRFLEQTVIELKSSDALASLNDGALASALLDDAVVIALCSVGSEIKLVQPGLISLPYLAVDYATVLPCVDLIIHHGGAGTTIAATKAGVPQIVVPNKTDCSDQMFHGARVAAMGCGTLLTPHGRFTEKTPELKKVVEATRRSLQELPALEKACLEWKAKLQGSGRTEGVPVAVDAVRRLVATLVMADEGCSKPIRAVARPRSME